MSGLAPLPGSTETVLACAVRLQVIAGRLDGVRGVLAGLHAGARWDSPAGQAFSSRVGELPAVLDSMASRYAGASAALRTFAVALQEAQDACSREIDVHDGAVGARIRYAEALAGIPVQDAAGRARTLGLLIEASRQVDVSEHRFLAARERFEEADRRCCCALAELAHDWLDDSLAYRSLTGVSNAAHETTRQLSPAVMVPLPAGKVLGLVAATTGGIEAAADAVVLARYGDGDGEELATTTGLAALGFASGALRLGARAGGVRSAAESGPSQQLSLVQRLRTGTKEQIRANHPAPRVGRALRGDGSPDLLAVLCDKSRSLRGRLATVRSLQAQRLWLDDLAVASRNGDQATAMLAASWGLRVSGTGYRGWDKFVNRPHAASEERSGRRPGGRRG